MGRLLCADENARVEVSNGVGCELELEPNGGGSDVDPNAPAPCCVPGSVELVAPNLRGALDGNAEPPKGCAKGSGGDVPNAPKGVAEVELDVLNGEDLGREEFWNETKGSRGGGESGLEAKGSWERGRCGSKGAAAAVVRERVWWV